LLGNGFGDVDWTDLVCDKSHTLIVEEDREDEE